MYNLKRKVEFDPVKNDSNIRERGLAFERVVEFDLTTAIVERDLRKPYPEDRWVALGFLDARLHVLCFTPIHGGIRVISFRKSNPREIKSYAQATATD